MLTENDYPDWFIQKNTDKKKCSSLSQVKRRRMTYWISYFAIYIWNNWMSEASFEMPLNQSGNKTVKLCGKHATKFKRQNQQIWSTRCCI